MGGFEDFLLSGTFFTVFMAVIVLLMAAGITVTVLTLIRGKGKAKSHVLLDGDDDGSMRPAPHTGFNPGQELHQQAHQQAMQQALLTQSLHQPGVNGPPPGP
ncbi:hypothetical protein CVS30_08505 [Arthrobacter psychrolactophilus]|uniref:Uncharacterized protein n=1 Tax=Arthrobacter psychrolactophilus TaxID=92442 RepID=A0A2V5JGF3_9MICC|nr:hypothetical protein [Arthrobacter psychrolactophilus]PYI38857.1 hypothetical protein CVS30_08505 [Arthrobacter psychrolactophilus]